VQGRTLMFRSCASKAYSSQGSIQIACSTIFSLLLSNIAYKELAVNSRQASELSWAKAIIYRLCSNGSGVHLTFQQAPSILALR
jgi:spore coat protein U-like protein